MEVRTEVREAVFREQAVEELGQIKEEEVRRRIISAVEEKGHECPSTKDSDEVSLERLAVANKRIVCRSERSKVTIVSITTESKLLERVWSLLKGLVGWMPDD